MLLVDDRFLRLPTPPSEPRPLSWPARIALGWIFYATVVVAPGISHLLPRPLLWPATVLEPFRIANRYGLFAVMTTERYEIEFQGSRDGVHWTPYPFRYKPQDPMKAPGIYAPYQPRFEWNLWFASLGEWRRYPWVLRTEMRLLEGSPAVLHLFAKDPFPDGPPAYRARGQVAVLVHHAGGEAGDGRLLETRGPWPLRARAASGERGPRGGGPRALKPSSEIT